jgi:hypothetical protein
MDLGDWLRSLGLEQYEAAFRENAIDETVLHDLTEDHLREIGIPLGARLKLLKAIACLVRVQRRRGSRRMLRPRVRPSRPTFALRAAAQQSVLDVFKPTHHVAAEHPTPVAVSAHNCYLGVLDLEFRVSR